MTTPQEIFDAIKGQQQAITAIAEQLKGLLMSGSFTLADGEDLIDKIAMTMASTDKSIEDIESIEDVLSIDQEDALSDMAGTAHDFGSEILMLVMDKVRQIGGNPNLIYKAAQERHYP
ncbi:hypothetical protein [Paracoccus sp. pheM1]|uniref:hypothetical protein n=1 Tax=Paracoccus sp. pheM1 TaxID=2831675 RepID=UPI001BDB8F7C|nr:hypothetical protein [Paracoccus sp. pheM1]MBT0778058.1 hypothetical protein [Paracoccus sp. pheM1]